jgi:hypothetical protein
MDGRFDLLRLKEDKATGLLDDRLIAKDGLDAVDYIYGCKLDWCLS